MPGYKHPCKYCGKLVSSDEGLCPFCGKVNPTEPYRCPRCRHPIDHGQIRCSDCGQSLRVKCPHCAQETFFGDYCGGCGKRLTIKCRRCGEEQPPLGNKCIKCGKPLGL